MRFLGVDVTGSTRDWDWILVERPGGPPQHGQGSRTALLDFIRQTLPNVVAVDAPSKRNCGLMRQPTVRTEVLGARASRRSKLGRELYDDCRVCEAELGVRNVKSYFTSGERTPPEWVGAGLRLYQDLAEIGYMTWDAPGPVSTIASGVDRIAVEVYPHACFVVRLGWIPQLKTSLGGVLERIACLRAWSAELGVPLEPGYDDILDRFATLSWEGILDRGAPRSVSHDKLDALAAAFTAMAAASESPTAFAIGRRADGVIVLPRTPDANYRGREWAKG